MATIANKLMADVTHKMNENNVKMAKVANNSPIIFNM